MILPILPTFPEVRCDRCRTVYTIAEQDRPGVWIRGHCPKCGHDRFSTQHGGDVPAVVCSPLDVDESGGVRDELAERRARESPSTVWRITKLHALEPLDVRLTVDTVAPLVVAAIEAAAELHSITLERIEPLEEV